jgi:hypothetical protein
LLHQISTPDASTTSQRMLENSRNEQHSTHRLMTTLYDSQIGFTGGYTRAGWAGKDMVVCDFLDTADASAVERDVLGHSYYGGRTILSDVYTLIDTGKAPPRFALNPAVWASNNLPYWISCRSLGNYDNKRFVLVGSRRVDYSVGASSPFSRKTGGDCASDSLPSQGYTPLHIGC